ncbi:large-conductance mechanosensitive channel [Paenibacillus sp. RC254]|uniref:hypothetical protein n=1 Tax=unclassified Paenibacillus TaxID=185978 RepID=UPI0024B9D116|nr:MULTISPECIES: hypothetical protein [unclassified Paenibacillus]
MKNIWRFIIALLIGNIIGNLTYGRLEFFQYNTGTGFFTLENLIKFIIDYGLAVIIALIIYVLIGKLFIRSDEK